MEFQNFERLYLKTSIMALEYFFHYSFKFWSQLRLSNSKDVN